MIDNYHMVDLILNWKEEPTHVSNDWEFDWWVYWGEYATDLLNTYLLQNKHYLWKIRVSIDHP